MYCNNCGASIDDNSRFCIHCGQQINNSSFSSNVNNNDSGMNENQYQEYSENSQQFGAQQNSQNTGKAQFINTTSYDPIGMWGYFGYELLFAIPIVGLILMIVFSFTASNINVRNFARAYLIMSLIGLIIAFFVWTSMGISIFNLFNRYR